MAYFDSTKNRALWEIRLAELKKERAAREAGGGAGAGLTQNQPQVKTANPTRVRVSYQQLLQEEAKALAKEPPIKPKPAIPIFLKYIIILQFPCLLLLQ